MIESKPGVALITGASSGIGQELARTCARHHHDLVLVARNEDRLLALADELAKEYGIQSLVISADLLEPESPQRIHERCVNAGLHIHVLINNAGFGAGGSFAATDIPSMLAQLQVNIVALTHLTRLFLPAMVSRNAGRILHVASTAGFQPGPFMAVYYASKAYVISFSAALTEELRGTSVTSTVLCPGPTATDFQRRAGITNAPIAGRLLLKTPEFVAERAYAGMMKGNVHVIPGLMNKAGVVFVKLLPGFITRRVVGLLNRKRPV